MSVGVGIIACGVGMGITSTWIHTGLRPLLELAPNKSITYSLIYTRKEALMPQFGFGSFVVE